MLYQPLLDKLCALRLTGFRPALEEQFCSPPCAELPFEDRLGLLVDRECTRRDNSRLRRSPHAARFQQPGSIEDLDLAPARGLDRGLLWKLAQGPGGAHALGSQPQGTPTASHIHVRGKICPR